MALNVHPAHVDAIKAVVAAKKHKPFCLERHRRNVLHPPQNFSRQQFWKHLVGCLCSSVQKSGPGSPLSGLLRATPFALSLKTCEDQRDLGAYALTVISDSGLRFGPTISQRLAANLGWLNKGGWAQVKSEFLNLATIPRHAFASECITKERHAARFVMTMDGFGPKQSRNLWQCMGVSRYEIPLDSRLAKWVNALPATFGMDTKKLPNAQYYEQVESHVQAVCEAAGVFPCDFDAAVFVSADDGEWPENDQVR